MWRWRPEGAVRGTFALIHKAAGPKDTRGPSGCSCGLPWTQGEAADRAGSSCFWPLESVFCPGLLLSCTQSCLTLCDPMDPMDCSPPGSSVHGISQAQTLEWVAISSSRGSSQPRDQTRISCMAGGFFTSESMDCKSSQGTDQLCLSQPSFDGKNQRST